jgi:hypothetical protein
VSTTGNDSYGGNASSPWRTIQKCANTISGGDVCIVKDGIYVENVNISRSGTLGSLLYIKAENSRQAVINGKIIITGHYVQIEGFKVILQDGSQDGINSSGNYNYVIGSYISTDSNALGYSNMALRISGSNSMADGNYVEKTCFGIGLTGQYNTIQNNEVTKLINGSCGDVDYMRFFGTGHMIRRNYFHGINMNEIGGAHVDCFQSFDNGGAQHSIINVVVEGNYCSDAHQGMMLEGRVYGLSDGLLVRNNIFKNCGSWGINAHKIRNVRVFNNTFDMTGGFNGMGCREESSCEVKNNIFYNGTSLYWYQNSTIIDGTPEAPGKNNLLFRTGITIAGYSGDVKNQDPLFVNRGFNNYKLRPESPARDAGIAINGWVSPVDKDGISRPQGPYWDIGPYEYRVTNLGSPQNFRSLTN